MPKGIRKACANCIKARLACDEGRPCQRCVVHACECVAVPRKPRVKKQKIDMEPPPINDKLNIPSIDTSCDVVVPNWSHNEFAQGGFGAFQLDRNVQDDPQFDGYAPNPLLSPTTQSPRLSPLFDSNSFQAPMLQMASPITSQIPSPPQVFTPPSPAAPSVWASQTRQLQAALVQQLLSSSSLSSSTAQQQQQQTPPPQQLHLIQHPIQPVHTIQSNNHQAQANAQPHQSVQQPSAQQQLSVQQQQQQHQQQQQQSVQRSPPQMVPQSDIKPLRHGYDGSQMLSLLLEEKPSALLNDWQDAQLGAYMDVQGQAMNFYDPVLFKKHLLAPHISGLPQAMNATALYPAPIAVFDKLKFQLLDANEAMAQFIGMANVSELAAKVTCMDDLIDSEAAQVAKQAYVNFVTNPAPCYRLGEVRTHNGSTKTVEFHVDLTEQLLILTIKNVFDSSSKSLPDMHYPNIPIKSDMSMQQCKAFEFLSPID